MRFAFMDKNVVQLNHMKKKMKASKQKSKKSVSRNARRDTWTIKRIWLPIGLAVIALGVVTQAPYTRDYQTNVLGDENGSQEEQRREEEKQREEEQKQNEEAEKHIEEPSKEEEKNKIEVSNQNREVEVQTATGQKIKAKIEDDGSRKVEAEFEGVHFKFESHEGELKLKAVDNEGEDVATAEAERKRLEQELEDEDIKLASEDGEVELEHNGMKVRTNFPLSIDPVTRELTVTTPAGTKTVTILPDQAVNGMLERGLLTSISPANESGESNVFQNAFALTLHKDQSVYEIHGEKKSKLLGLIPVTLDRTVYVSTENGSVVAQQETLLSTLLSFLSF